MNRLSILAFTLIAAFALTVMPSFVSATGPNCFMQPILPSGIYNYTCATLNNAQSIATSNGFAQLVVFPTANFTTQLNAADTNMAFYWPNSTQITSLLQTNNTNTSIVSLYWLKIPGNLAATSNTQIVIGFAPKPVNLITGSQAGEICQLSGANSLDTGYKIFTYYQNFCSSALGGSLPSGWTGSTGYAVAFGTKMLNLTTGTAGTYNAIHVTSPYSANTPGNTVDALLNVTAQGTSGLTAASLFGIYDQPFGGTSSAGQVYATGASGAGTLARASVHGTINTGNGPALTHSPEVFSFSIYNAITANFLINYTSWNTIAKTGTAIGKNLTVTTNNAIVPTSIFWIDTRPNPPANVMPSTSFSPIYVTAPVYIQNTTAKPAITYPSYAGIPACANTIGGVCIGNDVITGSNTLSGNLQVIGNLTVPSGTTLTTNGFYISATYKVTATGATISPGSSAAISPIPGPNLASPGCPTPPYSGGNLPLSYGGSGGGGGGNYYGGGACGGNTIANAGAGGGNPGNVGQPGGNGGTPTIPTITQANAILWCNNPGYLAGASGGGAGYQQGNGGAGTYGVCISANTVALGTLTLTGGTAVASGGCGGGGVAIVLYGSGGVTFTTNNIAGGTCTGNQGGVSGAAGGNGGAGQIKASNLAHLNITIPTIFPFKFYTSNPAITYTLNVVTGATQTILQTGTSLAYNLTANKPSGLYNFSITESDGTTSATFPALLQVSMNDIGGQFTYNTPANTLCQTPFQYGEDCIIYPFGSNTFNAKPSWWYIASDLPTAWQNGTGGKYNIVNFSNANTSFKPRVFLTYNSFSPAITFQANALNNPILQSNIIQPTFNFLISNGLNASRRNLANFTVFSQETFNSVNTILSTNTTVNFNGYAFNVIANASGANLYYLSMLKSNYQNLNITLNLNDTAQTPLFYAHSDTYCPVTLGSSSAMYNPIGLVDTNGSRYQFYVYTSGGQQATGYIMQVKEQKGTSGVVVQNYKIPAQIPFILALEATGQQYGFTVFSSNCKSVFYKGAFTQPANPTYITLNVTPNAYIYNTTNVTAACKIVNTINGNYIIQCFGADSTSKAYAYKLQIAKTTSIIGSQVIVVNSTFLGQSFGPINYTEPSGATYGYNIYAFVYQNTDPIYLFSALLNFQRITVSQPLLGFIAFLLLLTLILGGASTGKIIIMMLLTDVGLFVVALLVTIPSGVAVFFAFMSILAIWYDRGHPK